jgi:hypothetical protein
LFNLRYDLELIRQNCRDVLFSRERISNDCAKRHEGQAAEAKRFFDYRTRYECSTCPVLRILDLFIQIVDA